MKTAKTKILVVEDNPVVGEDLRVTLSGFGYEVLGPITSGEETEKQFPALAPDFVLMDINLAGKLDGIETAERLQARSSTPVAFLTALDDEATLQRAKLVRPFGYLLKPFDARELHALIELTLQRYKGDSPAPVIPIDDEAGGPADGSVTSVVEVCALFNGTSPAEQQYVAGMAHFRAVNAGEYIVHEGDPLQGMFIPVTGRIGVTKTADSGRELIVALLASGDPFGSFFHFAGFDKSCAVRAQVDSKILWIPAREWSEVLARIPQVYRNVGEALATRLASAHLLSSSLAHAKVEGRIISALLALLPNFGCRSARSAKEERIYITRKELSELTGTTPETAIRVTKNLERNGILDLSRPGIIKILNVDTFRELLAS